MTESEQVEAARRPLRIPGVDFVRRRLSVKLALFGLLVAVVPLATLAWLAREVSLRGITTHTELHLRSAAALESKSVSRWLDMQAAGALVYAEGRRSLREFGDAGDQAAGRAPSRNDVLTRLADPLLFPWRSVILADSETGKVAFVSGASANPGGVAGSEAFRRGRESRYVDMHVGGPGPGTLTLAQPVFYSPGYSGVLILEIDAAALVEVLRPDDGLGPGGTVQVLDAAGMPILGASGDGRVLVGGKRAAEPGAAESVLLRLRNYDGSEAVGEVRQIDGTPWRVLVTIPKDLAFSDLNELRLIVFAAIGGTALVSATLAGVLGMALARPVKRLARWARTFNPEKGDAPDVPVTSFDEVGELTRSFNRMARRLTAATGELVEKNRDLARADEMKSRFLSTVAHELRTPLTSSAAFTDILSRNKERNLTARQLQQLHVVQRNNERLKLLIEDLLNVSRLQSGALKLEKTEFEIGTLMREVAESFGPLYAEKRQVLRVLLPREEVWTTADRDRISQATSNLLSNASKYSPEGAAVELVVARVDGGVRVAVQDHGVGISEEDRQQLFTEFFRADDPAVRSVPGTGLGLVITRSLVELHGGAMSVESELGVGSTFAFWIPGSQPRADGGRARQWRAPRSRRGAVAGASPGGKAPSVHGHAHR